MDSPISLWITCSYRLIMRVIRFSGFSLLAIYIFLHAIYPNGWPELFIYNLIPIAAVLGISYAPHIFDKFAKPSSATAVGLWTFGSAIASTSIFYSLPSILNESSSVFYVLFYPLAIVGLPRLLAAKRKLSLIEIVDSTIFGLGLTTLGSALFAKPLLPHFSGDFGETFFAIMYPVADLVLVCVVIVAVLMQGFSRR